MLRKFEDEHRLGSNTTHPSYHPDLLIPTVLTLALHCRDSTACEYRMPRSFPKRKVWGVWKSPSRWWPVAIFWRNSDARVRNKSSCCCSWSQVTTDNHTLPPIRSASYLLTTLSLGQLDCQMMKPSGSIYSCPRWVVVAVIPMVITGHRSTKSVP